MRLCTCTLLHPRRLLSFLNWAHQKILCGHDGTLMRTKVLFLCRLSPLTNEVAPKSLAKGFTFLLFSHFTAEGDCATPQINASILADLTTKQNETLKFETLKDFKNLKDGILLLKVWLKQRELDKVSLNVLCFP